MPGIGKKTAERLIIELRDKLGDLPVAGHKATSSGSQGTTPAAEAVQALQSLGYKPVECQRMVRDVNQEGMSAEEIIRKALKARVK